MLVPALFAVFGSYWLVSTLLLRRPFLVHKKKEPKFRCVHISHRGGAGENLENTSAAFTLAVEVGTDMLEIDVHITRDDRVVITHDDDLSRLCGQKVRVRDTDYANLPKLRSPLPIDFDSSRCTEGTDRNIMLLEDLFRKYPDLPINVDIKVDDDRLIDRVHELIQRYQREDITVWGNKSDAVAKKLYSLNPRIPVLLSMRRVLLLAVAYWVGALPFLPIHETCYEMVMPTIFLKSKRTHGKYRWLYVFLLHLLEQLFLHKKLIRHLSARGIHTYLWVVNTEEGFQRAFDIGATGVMTDYPTKLRHWLDARKVVS